MSKLGYDPDKYRCRCKYCEEARWLNRMKPTGVRQMMIVLRRHHAREQQKAAAGTAAV